MNNDVFLDFIKSLQNQIVANNPIPLSATTHVQKEKDALETYLKSSFASALDETLREYLDTGIENEIKEKLQQAIKDVMESYKHRISKFESKDDFDIKVNLDNSYKQITVTITPKTSWAEYEIKKYNQQRVDI